MYKPTLLKLLKELKNNIERTLNDHPKTKLYIKTWVIGEVDMMISKANGNNAFVYPYNASYKTLFNTLTNAFFCLNISEELKEETTKQLNTTENIVVLQKLSDLINK